MDDAPPAREPVTAEQPVLESGTTKRCRRCLQSKILDAFHVKPGMADGRANVCRECVNDTNRQRRAAGVRRRQRGPHVAEPIRIAPLDQTRGFCVCGQPAAIHTTRADGTLGRCAYNGCPEYYEKGL